LYYKLILGKLGHRCIIQSSIFVEHAYNVFVGDDVTINETAILQGSCDGRIVIGNRVHISYGAIILTTSLNFRGTEGEEEHKYSSVVIEDDVWIAAGSVILPGVKIGRGSVVAAGAVVTKDTEPGTIVAGVPAKIIQRI